jgi:hypothetical protein
MQNLVEVTKANGLKQAFDPTKLLESLRKSGATSEDAESVLSQVSEELYPGISTRKIYRKAFDLLKNKSRSIAARYNLKNAIMELGPSGYSFEKYVGHLLKSQGYVVQVGQIIQGACVTHEVDVIAEKEDHHFMVECKYHNQPGTVSDVKIPLYIQSRFKDIEAQWKKLPAHGTKFHEGWVVTNTRFTSDAIKYGTCVGLKLLGWDYPTKGSLKDIIDLQALYPVTCLTSLTRQEKKELLQKEIVLCVQLCADSKPLLELGIQQRRINQIVAEGSTLCSNLLSEGKHQHV